LGGGAGVTAVNIFFVSNVGNGVISRQSSSSLCLSVIDGLGANKLARENDGGPLGVTVRSVR
jgi:hypothetical protein